MRRCRLSLSLAPWTAGLTVREDAVAQVVRPRRITNRAPPIPLRSLIARRRLRRGERLCMIPDSHILCGASAAQLLRRSSQHEVFSRRTAAPPAVFATRDALLLTAALLALRRNPNEALSVWAQSLPMRRPPAHWALAEMGDAFTPMRRRAEGGWAASPALLEAFQCGRRMPMTRRQHEAANSQRGGRGSAVRHYIALNTALHEYAMQLGTNGEEEEKEQEAWVWAHFMVRSRCVNLRPDRADAPLAAVVPFVDMLNHASGGASAAYKHNSDEGGVVVVAARALEAGEELTLDYGNYAQRGCLFCATDHTPADGVAQMRRMEARQWREWDDTREAEDGGEEKVPFGYGRHERASLMASCLWNSSDSPSSETEAELEARLEATWLWRFGFPRGEEERLYAASRLWSKGLKQRIAHLTDVRRRGRPGEFVIGVPEGLRHLREERERLQREQYGGAAVFPPQKE